MKPVCHVDDTDSLAAAAAARATGAIASPEVTTINNETITCSATPQRVTQLSSPATAANTKATQSISALASRVGCGSFAQLKPPRHFGAERRDSPASPIGAARRFHSDHTRRKTAVANMASYQYERIALNLSPIRASITPLPWWQLHRLTASPPVRRQHASFHASASRPYRQGLRRNQIGRVASKPLHIASDEIMSALGPVAPPTTISPVSQAFR